MTFRKPIDGQSSRLVAGETVHVPADVVHSGGNIGAVAGRRVVIFSPAGMENSFLETGARAKDAEVDLRSVLASAARHGWEFVAGQAG